MRDALIRKAIEGGFDVIVDDTNLDPKHKSAMNNLIVSFFIRSDKKWDIGLELKEFKTSLAECIERDAKREKPVGEKVIREMNDRYGWVTDAPEPFKPAEGSRKAIICDIDGTLAHFNGRSPYDFTKVSEDTKDGKIHQLLDYYRNDGYVIILMSGRDSVCRKDTEEWLRKHKVTYDYLYMRPEGDSQKDFVIKLNLFNEHVRDRWDVELVIDDRLRVCRMWHSLGLKLLRVGDPDTDF